MANVIPFYRIQEERKNYIFINNSVTICRAGENVQFPCIALYRKGIEPVPVRYPLFERWYIPVDRAEAMATATMRKRSAAVCAFLNYLLWETKCSQIHEITLNDIYGFLISYKTKENGQLRSGLGWDEGIAFVYEFLGSYYDHNKEVLQFSYKYEDLVTAYAVRNESTGRQAVAVEYNHLSVKAPKKLTKKNRLLLFGYLEFFLWECEMYDPELTLGVALQAYAGIREGEVVNLTYDRIILRYGGFGRISDVILDLTAPAPFALDQRKTDFGKIKVPRKQMVYPDFVEKMRKLYDKHMDRHNTMGCETTGNNAVFLNRWKKPMSVDTYKGRVKKLFYEHFLPDLKKASEQMGTWAIDAPYIEAFEEDYPGAHAFRHWFTMYLFQRAQLTHDEISKWRGDKSQESMLTYIHVNADMLESFKMSAHTFQRSWLEEVL